MFDAILGGAAAGLAIDELKSHFRAWLENLKDPTGSKQAAPPTPDQLLLFSIYEQVHQLNKYWRTRPNLGTQWDVALLQAEPHAPVKVLYYGRKHWAMWLAAQTNILVRIPGIGQQQVTAPSGLTTLDLPEGTEISLTTAGSAMNIMIFRGDYVPSSQF